MTERQKQARGKRAQSIGQKRPFTKEQVQLIRANLLAQGDWWQTALFETALSTCLRASDVLSLTVADVGAVGSGYMNGRFPVKQIKTSRVIMVALSGEAQAAIRAVVQDRNLGPKDVLFHVTRQHYGRIVKDWARLAHLDPKHYSTHSMRRTKPAHIYKLTKNARVAQELLGHADLGHTGAYLGIGINEALEISEEHKI